MPAPRPNPIEPDGFLDGLRWGAILLGAIVDNLLTLFGMTALMVAFAGDAGFSQDEDAAREAMREVLADPGFLAAGLVLGLLATVTGAFVGARRAGRLHLRHGGWVAVCSAALSLVFLLGSETPTATPAPLWYELIGWTLMIPAGLVGGLIAARLP